MPEGDIHVIVCCYYLTAQELLSRYGRALRLAPGIRIDVYSTNDAHPAVGPAGIGYHRTGNACYDFSAYMAACRDLVAAGESRQRNRVFVFLNDTLFTRHPGALMLRLLQRVLPSVRSAETPILTGKADTYRVLLQTSPFAPGLDSYISTFLFATNGPGVELLNELFAAEATQRMMQAAADLRSDLLPEKFVAFLRYHLQSADPRFSWQGARGGGPLGPKAVCVLLEHLISARFFERGFIFPMNYSPLLEWVLWGAYRLRRAAAGLGLKRS